MTKRGVNLSVISEETLPLSGDAECPHDLEPSAAKQIAQTLRAILRQVWFSTWWEEAWVRDSISVGVLADINSANALLHRQLWTLIFKKHIKEGVGAVLTNNKQNNSKQWLHYKHSTHVQWTVRKAQILWKPSLISKSTFKLQTQPHKSLAV